VSGAGKTTLATALAREWRMEFVEGDDVHSKANIEKMTNGCALNDQDREPWLQRIRDIMEQKTEKPEGDGLVITCSALKRYYRDILRGRLREGANPSGNSMVPTYFVFIKGSREMILQRLRERKGHYMKSDMLDGQFDDLESPEGEGDVVVVDAEDSTESKMRRVKEQMTSLRERM
jgi:gluconokinase